MTKNLGLLAILTLTACADDEKPEEVLCTYDGEDLFASDGYTRADCESVSDGEDTGPGTTILTDVDNDGVTDGREDPVIYFDDEVCLHTSIIGWTTAAYVVGYGFTGEFDWSTLIHELLWKDSADGTEKLAWGCYAFADYGWVYRVNVTRLGADGPADFTNWANLTGNALGDELTWFNPDHTLALCFTAIDGVIKPASGSTCDVTYGETAMARVMWQLKLIKLELEAVRDYFGL